MLRELVRQSGVAALSVDYRLSPEHRFPVAFDEMVAMIRLAAREGAGLRHRPDAARGRRRFRRRQSGAGRRARVARRRRARARLHAADLWRLSRPTARARPGSVSAAAPVCRRPRCAGSGRPISNARSSRTIGAPPRSSPTSPGLPPAHLIVGSLDPLLDDSHRLAARLKEAGVPCELRSMKA